MKWMDQKQFWLQFEQHSSVQIDYSVWYYFEISEERLQTLIGETLPNTNLAGEDDPPGPVARWYGDLNGIPVLLDFSKENPNVAAATVYHGGPESSRDLVRNFFRDWGTGWKESKRA